MLPVNTTGLAWQVDDKRRRIYMVRVHFDGHGQAHEENRTTFHVPAWYAMSKKQWAAFKDNWFADVDRLAKQNDPDGHLHKLDNPKFTIY